MSDIPADFYDSTDNSDNNDEKKEQEEREQIIDIVAQRYKEASDAQLTDKWAQFIKRFQHSRYRDGNTVLEKPYLDQIIVMDSVDPLIIDLKKEGIRDRGNAKEDIGRKIFEINYEDLAYAKTDILNLYDYDKDDDQNEKDERAIDVKVLCYGIRNDWEKTQRVVKDAVLVVLERYNHKYLQYLEKTGQREKLLVTVTNFEITKNMSDLATPDLDKFVRLKGVVSEFDDQLSVEVSKTGWRCSNSECNVLAEIRGRKQPKKCPGCDGFGTFPEEPESKVVDDFMYFVLQETNDVRKEGQMLARTFPVCCMKTDFVQSVMRAIEIGLEVAVNGVVTLSQFVRGNSVDTSLEFECYGLEVVKDSSTAFDEELRELVEQPIPTDRMADHYEKLKRSIAPHLEGLDEQKEFILLALAGSPPLIADDGSRIRGELNGIFIGDAATGKTELLHFANRVSRKSVYVQGSNASKVGLTASIKSSEILRAGSIVKKSSLQAGVYGMVRSGAHVLFDEIDKVSDSAHYEAISTAMDDVQVMYVHKNAAHTEIKVDCGSIHAGNPSTNQGKYDVTKSVYDQTNFSTWLWSRYDLKFLHISKRDDASRFLLWKRKERTFGNVQLESDVLSGRVGRRRATTLVGDEEIFTIDYLIHEMAYLRQNEFPELKPGSLAWVMMQKTWDWYNQRSILQNRNAKDKEKYLFVPQLDERAINSITRIARASARLHRRKIVDMEDMSIALNLIKESVAQFTPHWDEQDEEMKALASSTVLLNEGLKNAIALTNRAQNEMILNHQKGLIKTVGYMHKMLFIPCDACKGTGHMGKQDQQISPFLGEHVPCHSCQGMKGYYHIFDFHQFLDICENAKTAVYAENYFGLLQKARFIEKEAKTEKVMPVAGSKANLSGTYKIIRYLKGNAVVKLVEIINEVFEVEQSARMAEAMHGS